MSQGPERDAEHEAMERGRGMRSTVPWSVEGVGEPGQRRVAEALGRGTESGSRGENNSHAACACVYPCACVST